MEPAAFYGAGSRAFQRFFGTSRLAGHLARSYVLAELQPVHQQWVRRSDAVHVATVGADGQPDCSYKGGRPGFISVADPRTLEIPSYDGNGMYRTLGNTVDDGRLALLFLLPEVPAKLRVHGVGRVHTDPAALARHVGAEAVLRIAVTAVYENCPRYLHAPGGQLSVHCPRPGHQPPEPEWKSKPEYVGLLPSPPPSHASPRPSRPSPRGA